MIHQNQIQTNQETRSITIRRAVHDYLLKTSAKEIAFADEVVKHYHRLVSNPEARTLRFHDVKTERDLKANKQLLFRMLNGDVKLIADIEEAIVCALPVKESEALKVKLMLRHGSYYAPILRPIPRGEIIGISKLMNHTGDLLEKLAPIIDDLKIDENDLHLAPAAIESIDTLVGALMSWRVELVSIDEHKPPKVVPIKTENKDSA